MNHPDDTSSIPAHRAHGGVFITKGARLAIPAGGLKIWIRDGKIDSSLTVHVGLNVVPIWTELAVDHTIRAQVASETVLVAWRGTDDAVLGDALMQEFAASMQAMVAAATAIDAFYAAIREHSTIAAAVIETWQRNRTARYKQVAEVLRRAFAIAPRNAVGLRAAIKDIYRFRDWAVHPPAEARAPARRPDLLMNTEWRFVAFSFANARELVRGSLSLLWQASRKTDGVSSPIREYCAGLSQLLEPIVGHWEDRFGPVTPKEGSVGSGAA